MYGLIITKSSSSFDGLGFRLYICKSHQLSTKGSVNGGLAHCLFQGLAAKMLNYKHFLDRRFSLLTSRTYLIRQLLWPFQDIYITKGQIAQNGKRKLSASHCVTLFSKFIILLIALNYAHETLKYCLQLLQQNVAGATRPCNSIYWWKLPFYINSVAKKREIYVLVQHCRFHIWKNKATVNTWSI